MAQSLSKIYIRINAYGDNHGSETLLAIVGAAPAKVVIGNSVSVVEEKAPFKLPFVAHAWHWYAPFCRFRGYHG